MNSQDKVRAGKVLRPLPSVAVRDRGRWKGVAGSGWVREAGRGKTAHGWKGVRPGVRLKTGRWEPGGARRTQAIISRLPGCDGQAADAVSAYTQVKMEDAHKLLKIPKSECPDIWIRLPRHKWPKSWSSMEDPVVPLERNQYGHPLAGLLWERQFETILLKFGWEKVSNGECLFVHNEKGLFSSVYVDNIK